MEAISKETTDLRTFTKTMEDFLQAIHYSPKVVLQTEGKVLSRCDFALEVEPNLAWERTISKTILRFLKRKNFSVLELNNHAALFQKDLFVVVIHVSATSYSKPKVGLTFMHEKES